MITLFIIAGVLALFFFYIMSCIAITDAEKNDSFAYLLLGYGFLVFTGAIYWQGDNLFKRADVGLGYSLLIFSAVFVLFLFVTSSMFFWVTKKKRNLSTYLFLLLLFVPMGYHGYRTGKIYEENIRPAGITEQTEDTLEKDLIFFTETEPNDPNTT